MKTTAWRAVPPIVVGLALFTTSLASATGTVKIQQSDGSISTYSDVGLKITKTALYMTSSDKVSTVVVSGATCTKNDDMYRCTGGGMTLDEDGKPHTVPFKSATFYFNLTDQDQTLSMSTMKLGAHSVMFVAQTAKGTFITGNGKIDEETFQ